MYNVISVCEIVCLNKRSGETTTEKQIYRRPIEDGLNREHYASKAKPDEVDGKQKQKSIL